MASQKKSMRGLSMKAAKGQHKVSEPETADGYLEGAAQTDISPTLNFVYSSLLILSISRGQA